MRRQEEGQEDDANEKHGANSRGLDRRSIREIIEQRSHTGSGTTSSTTAAEEGGGAGNNMNSNNMWWRLPTLSADDAVTSEERKATSPGSRQDGRRGVFLPSSLAPTAPPQLGGIETSAAATSRALPYYHHPLYDSTSPPTLNTIDYGAGREQQDGLLFDHFAGLFSPGAATVVLPPAPAAAAAPSSSSFSGAVASGGSRSGAAAVFFDAQFHEMVAKSRLLLPPQEQMDMERGGGITPSAVASSSSNTKKRQHSSPDQQQRFPQYNSLSDADDVGASNTAATQTMMRRFIQSLQQEEEQQGGAQQHHQHQTMISMFPQNQYSSSMLPPSSSSTTATTTSTTTTRYQEQQITTSIRSTTMGERGRLDGTIITPCKARGLARDHNPQTAFLIIPRAVRHGEGLLCSHKECQKRGIRFVYCKVCRIPVARINFSTRHKHGDATFDEQDVSTVEAAGYDGEVKGSDEHQQPTKDEQQEATKGKDEEDIAEARTGVVLAEREMREQKQKEEQQGQPSSSSTSPSSTTSHTNGTSSSDDPHGTERSMDTGKIDHSLVITEDALIRSAGGSSSEAPTTGSHRVLGRRKRNKKRKKKKGNTDETPTKEAGRDSQFAPSSASAATVMAVQQQYSLGEGGVERGRALQTMRSPEEEEEDGDNTIRREEISGRHERSYFLFSTSHQEQRWLELLRRRPRTDDRASMKGWISEVIRLSEPSSPPKGAPAEDDEHEHDP